MKKAEYYCDICDEPIPDYEDGKWHSMNLSRYEKVLDLFFINHTHLCCVEKFKYELDKILPEQKK